MTEPFYTPPPTVLKQLEAIASDPDIKLPEPGEKAEKYPTQRERCTVCRVAHVAGPYCGYCVGRIKMIRAGGKT